MSYAIVVMPLLGVEGSVETGRYDAVLAMMPESECGGCFVWPDVGDLPRVVVGCSDLGAIGLLTDAEVASLRASGKNVVLPTPDHVRDIIAFHHRAEASGWQRVLVHCHAAVSRSPAAALILAALQDGPGAETASAERIAKLSPFDDFAPNLTLITYADQLLERGGKLVQACRDRFKPKGGEVRL
jgi:hypothetical protein